MEKILVVGNNVRNVVQSARKAGYRVLALTNHFDADLSLYAERVEQIKFERENKLKKLVKKLAEENNAYIVLASGFEDLKVNNVLGSEYKVVREIVDKLKFYKKLESVGIPFPELVPKNEIDEKTIAKPRKGGGGEGICFVDKLTTKSNVELNQEYIVQKYIEGIPCSVSLIAGKGDEITPITINKMFVGWKEMNADGFRYSGNITPFIVDAETRKKIIKMAVETASLFDLKGSIGVDFILADKPYVLELNPRFQGSLDSIEWSCDINLFKLHVKGVFGKKIEKPKPLRFGARAILFADKNVEIKNSPVGNPFFADIPFEGQLYEVRDPITSILSADVNGDKVIDKIIQRKKIFYSLQGWSTNNP